MRQSINAADEKKDFLLTTEFCLKRFMFRYLAGESSLRESRLVSRKRLALVSSGIPTQDAEATSLYLQLERYNQAYNFLESCENITIEDLCHVNKLIEVESSNSGKIRKKQNWIGAKDGTLAQAKYVPPTYDAIAPMMAKLIKYINQTDIDHLNKADYAHSMLVIIHPFSDGNGRTARILWQVLNDRWKHQSVSPFIYRLHSSNTNYISALATFALDKTAGLNHPFWLESKNWCVQFEESCRKIINETKARLHSRICLSILSPLSQKILSLAWSYPIIYLPHLQHKISTDYKSTLIALDELLRLKIFNVRKVKYPAGEIVFECPDIIDCMITIESKIFL